MKGQKRELLANVQLLADLLVVVNLKSVGVRVVNHLVVDVDLHVVSVHVGEVLVLVVILAVNLIVVDLGSCCS